MDSSGEYILGTISLGAFNCLDDGFTIYGVIMITNSFSLMSTLEFLKSDPNNGKSDKNGASVLVELFVVCNNPAITRL
jgi:hypothetical protein